MTNTTVRTPADLKAEIARLEAHLGAAYATGDAWMKLQERREALQRELAAAEAAAPIIAAQAKAEADAVTEAERARQEAVRQANREARALVGAEIDELLLSLAEAHARLEAIDPSINDRSALRGALGHWCPLLVARLGYARPPIRGPLTEMLKLK